MKKQVPQHTCCVLHYAFTIAILLGYFCNTTSVFGQTTVFSYNAESDNINAKPSAFEIFNAPAAVSIQYDSGTTNKIIRVNAGSTTPSSYVTLRLQKTFANSFGSLQLAYKFRFNRLAQAINTTNAPNFNRFGFNGSPSINTNDANTAAATTAVSTLGLQGNFRAVSGLTFMPAGNFTPVNNVWYQINLNIARISATQVVVSGTIADANTQVGIKTLSGIINTTTPTLYMNQILFDIQAIYHYNTLDLDDILVTLPATAPSASNVQINGATEALQTVNATYTLTGSDTGGSKLQWFTAPSPTGPFTAIPGATNSNYQIGRSDIGKYLACTVYPITTSGFINGIPATAISANPVQSHSGPQMIRSIRQTGFVAVNNSVKIDYQYSHPSNLAEKTTAYTCFVSDSFNVGYYKKIAQGTTTADKGISLNLDTSLLGKYLYIELLPQDEQNNYGAYSGWTAQTAVQPEIQVLNIQYWKNGIRINDYGIDSGSVTVTADIRNNHLLHDTTGQLIVQLIDGFGKVVATSQSNVTLLSKNTQSKLVAAPLQVPNYFEGYYFKTFFADAANNTTVIGQPEQLAEAEEVNGVYQYYLKDVDSVNGAYLWIPPNTKTIKGIMVCINNNIERQVQENAEIRKVAAKWGLASLVLNTFRNSILAPPNYLSFDFTIPSAAAKFDSIIQAFAQMSNHPELVNAPYIPMAHSAYMDFPFHIAMRDNTKCIAAIPIKSGVPNIYNYYKGKSNGGTSNLPATDKTMKDVPMLFYQGFLPETVDGLYKTNPFRPHKQSLGAGFTNIYRNDDGTGIYKAGMEFGGNLLELYEGHFNAMPRALKIIAMFIDKACAARLPDNYPTDPTVKPTLKSLDFSKGWLVDQNYFNAKDASKYSPPAPYSQYTGNKKGTCWYFDEEMAKTCEQVTVAEYFKQVEQFSINKPDGSTDTLYQCVYNYHPKDGDQYTDSTGIMRLKVTSFTTPWPIDTAMANNKDSLKVPMKLSTNVLLPGITTLPVTNLPFKTNTMASCYKHLGNLVFKLRFNRFRPNPGGYTQSYVSVYREGNDTVAASLRNIRIDRTQSTMQGLKNQTINFPPIPPIDVNTRSITLKATASSGLPVDFIVRNGPAVVVGNQLYITQLHEGMKFPFPIVVSACQYGTTGKSTGFYAAGPVYRTIWIDNIAPEKPNLLTGIYKTDTTRPYISLKWQPNTDTLVNSYTVWKNNQPIATVSDTTFMDTALQPATSYQYYVTANNVRGNYSDSSNQFSITTPDILAVKKLQIYATAQTNKAVTVKWQIATSEPIMHQSVERSNDGIHFITIQTLSGNLQGSHSFTDSLISEAGTDLFYRIKVTEVNGQASYSKTVRVSFNNNMRVKAIPNPFSNHVTLQISTPKEGFAQLKITHLTGQIAFTKKLYLTKGDNLVKVNVSEQLAKGNYIAEIFVDGAAKATVQIVKN